MLTEPIGVKRVEDFCKKWDMLPAGALVLCAVSGGRDSMALLHLLWDMAERGGFRVCAAHFNHHLRPTADRDEAFVRDWCAGRGIPLTCGGGDAAAFAREEGTSLEDGARRLRYRFLEEAADRAGAGRIATAHHREDNAETLLFHLLRGAGLQGLGGIPPVRGRIVRPLLEISRSEIDSYTARHHIPYVEDETNADPRFTRNRLRLEVLPLLEEISPGCTGRIAAAAGLLREEDAYLQREAEGYAAPAGEDQAAIPLRDLEGLDRVVARRTVRHMARRLCGELGREDVERVLALNAGGYLDLPGGLCAFRAGGALTLQRQPALPPPLPLVIGEQTWHRWRVRLYRSGEPVAADQCTVVLGGEPGPLTIAAWDGQGRLRVENGLRTIKRLFADSRVPKQDRWRHPVVCADGRPAAVFGVATDRAFLPRPGERCLVVRLEA